MRILFKMFAYNVDELLMGRISGLSDADLASELALVRKVRNDLASSWKDEENVDRKAYIDKVLYDANRKLAHYRHVAANRKTAAEP
jgi:hypothetical protein